MTERQIQIARLLASVGLLGCTLLSRSFRRGRYHKALEEELERAHAREVYMAGMFDKYDIEVDEFDLIALRNL